MVLLCVYTLCVCVVCVLRVCCVCMLHVCVLRVCVCCMRVCCVRVCGPTHLSYLLGTLSGMNIDLVRTSSPHGDQSPVLIWHVDVISVVQVWFRGMV